ncbi:glycoside hydrolase family 105 protein [Moniliophthora roreri]|nr:glycoside hydrolase family 105 protein [Moniliophthora roreri]
MLITSTNTSVHCSSNVQYQVDHSQTRSSDVDEKTKSSDIVYEQVNRKPKLERFGLTRTRELAFRLNSST